MQEELGRIVVSICQGDSNAVYAEAPYSRTESARALAQRRSLHPGAGWPRDAAGPGLPAVAPGSDGRTFPARAGIDAAVGRGSAGREPHAGARRIATARSRGCTQYAIYATHAEHPGIEHR